MTKETTQETHRLTDTQNFDVASQASPTKGYRPQNPVIATD